MRQSPQISRAFHCHPSVRSDMANRSVENDCDIIFGLLHFSGRLRSSEDVVNKLRPCGRTEHMDISLTGLRAIRVLSSNQLWRVTVAQETNSCKINLALHKCATTRTRR